MWPKTVVLLVPILFLVEAGRIRKQGTKHFKNYNHVRRNASSNFGLWPSSFNLATKAIISVNATCGEGGREEFCRMVESGKGRCGICDNFSTDPGKKHPIGYAIDGTNKWWQSPALFYGKEYEYVTITIDLKQVYQITDVIIKAANSLRPGTWILERSLDDENYEAWQYFARSDKECLERFGVPATKGKPHYVTDSEVICTSFYSKLTPMENGEIHTSLMYGRPGANETSPELLQFTKARYVRLRLMGLRGMVEPLPRWFSQDINKDKRLFYTIRDISIVGHCVCNGHAENCRHNVASGHPECECAHHTCGSNCDKCCPMYNQRQWGPGSSRDARQCLPCNCHGHAKSCHYDENVDRAGLSMDINGNYQGGGVCDNCTAHTTGINCERCMPGYYQPPETPRHADKPCVKCDCTPPGSLGTCVQEGEFAGTCDCLPGYEGKKCDACTSGYKGWPKCESCPCDPRGVLEMEDCEGECICKANVEGKLCDHCKSGHFSLRSDNPEGCTQCFCSDVTTLCEVILVTPKKIQTLNGWLTTDLNISEVVKPIWDDKGLFSIGNYELPNIESLYWLAPTPYLANKLEYYGSLFTFKVHWVIMRGDTSGKPTTGPNIIMVGNNGLKIAHGNDFFTASNMTFRIKMSEAGWYHIPPDVSDIVTRMKRTQYVGDPVNRRQFLGILANVSHILLRATFHTDQIESLLEEATMHADSDLEITDVEKCSCPSGYSGLSCESCAFGYVRIMTNTTSKWAQQGFCGKCDCNGHSETCNPDTGECFCQHNTVGENCERCKPGFYGNPLRGTAEDCKKCACPLENDENNFSPSCQLDYFGKDDEKDGGYVCTQCPKGYTGDHCEICDDGYFGNPTIIGSICTPCNCNGGPCDRVTGQCLSCKGNTEGWRCERCKSGHYGDASTSNCISCQCDPLGAVSKDCHIETGQCQCRQRFTGRTCNKCETGYGNVTALCAPCACDPVGSKSGVCDQHTGLCECRPGVEGFHCDTCQNLHYGLSESGCEECKCDPQGSKFPTCDQNTGKCICKPHYKGRKCDQCESGYWKTNSTPCTPCNCNKDGSLNNNCDPNTGICHCKIGVQGQKCDSCQPKHYGNIKTGCKACDPCEKEGHICHHNNGKCVCPPLTNGAKCERCMANAWGHEPGIGCKACGCSTTGSSKSQCDLITGRCICKLGFEGEKCNRCSYGYYGYPNCRKCNCNVAGTLPEDCAHGSCKCSEQGCRCKANVEGKHCDRCKKGTFGIDPDNSSGCIDCFCSGRSTKCTASTYIWDQIRTNDVQKISSNKCINRRSCWNLPSKFTGDLTSSYGGYLRISSNTPANIIYLIGNGITLESATDSRGDLKILETSWKLKQDTVPPKMPKTCLRSLTRPCLMVVLQGVTTIQIAPKSFPQTIKFKEVLLDKISNTPGISQATSVERCHCPKEYTSPSCQDPNTGYYRHYPTPEETNNYIDRILGMARPCQCNGRSNVCDKRTGYCHNCTDFTTGPHCELCAEGHYKELSGNCVPCLCPSKTQNFAQNCTVSGKKQNQYVCICKEGYSGSRCNKCENGYWGNPQLEGGSCQRCNCNPFGSIDSRCDKSSGRCLCKAGFTGSTCAECTSPRQVIQNGICTPCDECTQILFYTIDNLSAGLNSTLDLFKNGLGPPWGLLNSTIYQYKLLSKRFDNIDEANKFIENANLPELKEKIVKMKQELPKRNKILDEQMQQIEIIQGETNNISKTVKEQNQNIDDLINKISDFGKSQIDTTEAFREAKAILDNITRITNKAPSLKDYKQLFTRCQEVLKSVNDIYKSNDINPNEIKAKLNEIKKKLSNFNVLLDQTDSTIKLTKIRNKKNAVRIADLNRTINEINSKNSIIRENVTQILKKIDATNDLLVDVKGIYDVLSKVDLGNATKSLDTGGLDDLDNTLYTVNNHVKNLQNKIKSYKKLFNFTPEEWKKIDASGAYDNLVKKIDEAKKFANEARNITTDILKMLYPPGEDSMVDKANLAKAFSDRLEKRVMNLKNLTTDYKKTAEELEELKHDILSIGNNNNQLNSVLRKIRDKIADQAKKMSKLEKEKENARNISGLIASIEQALKDTNITVQYELVKDYYKYLDLISKDEISKLEKKLDLTKTQLKEIDHYLNSTKFDKVQDANANKFNNTNENLTSIQEMIDNLNNMIKYANERAKAADYGLNIATCRRHYSVQNDILRSLDIYFKCETCTLFNITNSKNEVITLFVKNNIIHVKWKNQNKRFNNTNKISLQRIGFTVKIQPENNAPVTINDNTPFQIEKRHPFQVGDLKNKSEACLRKLRLNGQTIGLWRFNRSHGNCSACNRNISNDGLEDVFFNGRGYRSTIENSTDKVNPRQFSFIFTFATFDENSLIFIAQEKMNRCSYIALNLVDGYVSLKVRHVNGESDTITSQHKYNNGNITKAQVSLKWKNSLQTYSLELLESSEKMATHKKHLESQNVYKIKRSDISVGGVSSIFDRSCVDINTTPFLGNLKVTGDLAITSQNTMSYNIEPRIEKLEYDKAWFSGKGYVNLQSEYDQTLRITFSVRPVNTNHSFVMNIHSLMDIYIENSSLRVKIGNEEDLSVGCFSVNTTHLIDINETSVGVNNDFKNFTHPFKFPPEPLKLYLGADKTGKHPNFTGGILDIFDVHNNGPILFNQFTVKDFARVKIGRDEPESLLFENKCMKEMQNTERYARIPDYKTDPQAFKFGDKPNSFILIKNSFMGKKYVLEFQFRTFYPSGLLFLSSSYQPNRNATSYIVLDIQGGELRLRVQGHRAKTMNTAKKVNDGVWHYVQVEQIPGKKKWRLVVKLDKQWKLKDRVPKNNFKWELYVGGIANDFPVHRKLKNELHPFRGCIRSLKINRNLQTVKNNNNVVYNNIGQCFQKVEEGAYFGGDAFAIYKDDFKVNKFLELSFDFKTGEPNGILLSVSNLGNSPALSVELQNGAVVMTIDMGNGVISKVTNSPHSDATLANNEWHNITALYSSSELTVNVDGIRKSWVQSEVNSLMDEIEAPLYVGGLPNNAPSGTLKIKENFKGCIRKFKIEDNIMDWTDMKELNNVQLNSCLA